MYLTLGKYAFATALILVMLTAIDDADSAGSELSDLASAITKAEKVGVSGGRDILRFEHDSLNSWGYVPPQTDHFYLITPEKQSGKSALLILLHSSGVSAKQAMEIDLANHVLEDIGKSDSFYFLYPDCTTNRHVDWWWGYHAIKTKKDSENRLSPTELRVLSTIRWVLREFPIDVNRVYLSGFSMGGSGSLGIGLSGGDLFAAIQVTAPAGAEHAIYRMTSTLSSDPPPLVNFSSQIDEWSKGQEGLIEFMQTNHFNMVFAWGPFGHTNNPRSAHPAALDFPWLSIRKNEAYPAFTNTSTDHSYPGYQNTTAPDQHGQINAYFRWHTIEDQPDSLVMEIRLVTANELHKAADIPQSARADISIRRVQKFEIVKDRAYRWELRNGATVEQSGILRPTKSGLLTIPRVKVTKKWRNLIVKPSF